MKEYHLTDADREGVTDRGPLKEKEGKMKREEIIVKPFSIKWFESKFGKRPKGNIGKLQQEHRLAVSNMMQIERKLQDIDSWEKRRDAAIKAWIAHEKALTDEESGGKLRLKS